MIYKLSNTAEREIIETALGIPFTYPQIFTTSFIMNGLEEGNLSVVTQENPGAIRFAIWGLLPQNSDEEWHTFQNITNTLNILLKEAKTTKWMVEAYQKRRCLIIVTGFFTYHIENGKIKANYIGRKDQKPFLLAGIYNRLSDGFLSCALITLKRKKETEHYQNLGNIFPLIIPISKRDTWLKKEPSKKEIKSFINIPLGDEWGIHPIEPEKLKSRVGTNSVLKIQTLALDLDSY
jgi:putative SOS response-associated peptidase YedK